MISVREALGNNTYPGRGILLGRTPDGRNAVAAYFIMGRSVNSRNRIFVKDGDGLRTKAFDESKLTDPSLIIYRPVRVFGSRIVVTNGDQTDTICEYLEKGKSFESALLTRCFEPDAPNFTPRISGLLEVSEGKMSYCLSILKSDDGDPEQCLRFFFSYPDPQKGQGRLIHTYKEDGDPIPSFAGEPIKVKTCDDIDAFSQKLWEALDPENKVSLFVRYIDLRTKEFTDRILNKNN